MKTFKNRIALLMFSFFFIGLSMNSCSTTNDDNTPTTAVIPVTPTNLAGNVFSTTQINLTWTDNSTNENGFKIERKTGMDDFAIVGNANSDALTYSDAGLAPNTSYVYRVYSYNAIGNSATYSNEFTIDTGTPIGLPIITTTTAISITSSNASSGGTITSEGGSPVITRGVVWSTTSNPTIELSSKTTDGAGIGTFTSTISGLSANTQYYVRSYATNSSGSAYGNQIVFTTTNTSSSACEDSASAYPTVTIGGQIWMQKNLNACKYRNGDDIPQVTDPAVWADLNTGAWCYYENSTANGTVYGKLYNAYAVNDPRGLAPAGYHIPSDGEWTTLTTFLGGVVVAGGKMKATTGWESPNTDATNSSGFTGLPGGVRSSGSGVFYNIGSFGKWWSSTKFGGEHTFFRFLNYGFGSVDEGYYNNRDGYSVRCIKD